MNTYKSLTLTALVALLVSGCAVNSGNQTQELHTTLGEELRDLQQARETGAITDAEFLAMKAELTKFRSHKVDIKH